MRRALDVTVAFTTLESYTADEVLRSLSGSADLLRSIHGSAGGTRAPGASYPAAPRTADAPYLDRARAAGSPRRRPAPSRARRAHAATPAEQHCATPLPGGPRTPRAAPSSRDAPATVAARAAAAAASAAGGSQTSARW